MAHPAGIRPAQLSDSLAIQTLLEELGYPGTNTLLANKLEQMLPDPNEAVLVYEEGGKVEAFVSVHFYRQVGTEGDFARITYFAVKDGVRSKGIGGALEDYITELARKRNCDRIEVHCHSRRLEAHRFYLRQGYEESPKYFIKALANGKNGLP